MRMLQLFRHLPFLLVPSLSLCAQQTTVDAVIRASKLNDEGRFRETIELLEPVVAARDHGADQVVNGVAWNLLGVAYHTFGDRDKARRSYEAAIGILRSMPEQRAEYASVLDNFGQLWLDLGENREAESLQLRAKHIYEEMSDHAGVARVSSNLALTESDLGRRRKAQQYIAEALREEALGPSPRSGDLGAMYSVRALVSGRSKDYSAALASIDKAIEIWVKHYGPSYYLLAAGYSLRGQINERVGNRRGAEDDLARALEIFRCSGQSNSYAYISMETIYAKLLRDAGSTENAARVESEVKALMENLRQQGCSGCTISMAGFR
jgi:tetratricopeptide (TPR) repeat protein